MQLNVPYAKQATPFSCAIACLEMVARFYGATDFDQVATYDRIKQPIPGLKGQWGTRSVDLIQEAIRLGFDVQPVLFNFVIVADMMRQIQYYVETLQVPIIATQRSAMHLPSGHSRLVVGWEAGADPGDEPLVILHDPAAQPVQRVPPGGAFRKWKASVFAAMWKPNGVSITTGGEGIVIKQKVP